jgi:hypothetical protein
VVINKLYNKETEENIVRQIVNECKHNNGHLFAIHYRKGQFWGTQTGSDPDDLMVYRYCKDCREQMGYVDVMLSDENPFDTLEFTSPEFEEWFKKQNGEKT